MVSNRAVVLASVFLLLPLILLAVAVLAFDGNLFAILALLTWMGLGAVFGAAAIAEG